MYLESFKLISESLNGKSFLKSVCIYIDSYNDSSERILKMPLENCYVQAGTEQKGCYISNLIHAELGQQMPNKVEISFVKDS
jgi:hypothetical protein